MKKLAWLLPFCLLALGLNQIWVSGGLSASATGGEVLRATVTEYESVDRADVTYGYVDLAFKPSLGDSVFVDELVLPYTLIQALADVDTLTVRYDPAARQPVVIDEIVRSQSRMALIQGLMALGAALMFGWGIWRWL